MGELIAAAVGDWIFKMIVGAALFGFALCGLLFWGIPWLWNIAKPYVHVWTA